MAVLCLDQQFLLFASAAFGRLAGQGGEGADRDSPIWEHGPNLQIPSHGLHEVAQGAHQQVGPVLDLGNLGLLDIQRSGQAAAHWPSGQGDVVLIPHGAESQQVALVQRDH